MGIPFYFSYIIRNHSSMLHKCTSKTDITNLYIDANGIIYEAVAKHDNPVDIVNFVIYKLTSLIDFFHPTKLVYIAFDGVAPVSKLDQQRERRFKKRYDVPSDNPTAFNTIEITPGTQFMKYLNDTLTLHFLEIPKVIYSGCMEVGEGEHKILNYMRSNVGVLSTETNVIYGLDADLIMLALNVSDIIPKIFLAREAPHFVSTVDKTLEPNTIYLLDISELGHTLYTDTKCTIKDYILACFLLGNDFLPHFPAINIRTGGVHKILDTFVAARNIVNPTTQQIDWVQFGTYLSQLAMNEKTYIQNELNLRGASQKNYYPSRTKEELALKLLMLPTYERELEKKINPSVPGWEIRYYSLLFNVPHTKVTKSFIKHACLEYLYGLEWTYKYYGGTCPDWRWTYPYYYPPLLSDLVKYVPRESSFEFISPDMATITKPIDALTQLCYVLPLEYFNLLPPPLAAVLSTKYKHWYVPETEDPNFLWAFCKYFWEAHVILPEIPVNKLEQVVHRVMEYA